MRTSKKSFLDHQLCKEFKIGDHSDESPKPKIRSVQRRCALTTGKMKSSRRLSLDTLAPSLTFAKSESPKRQTRRIIIVPNKPKKEDSLKTVNTHATTEDYEENCTDDVAPTKNDSSREPFFKRIRNAGRSITTACQAPFLRKVTKQETTRNLLLEEMRRNEARNLWNTIRQNSDI